MQIVMASPVSAIASNGVMLQIVIGIIAVLATVVALGLARGPNIETGTLVVEVDRAMEVQGPIAEDVTHVGLANLNGIFAAGGTETEVIRVLGEPQNVRYEPPSIVWHYATPRCKLDVFFYFDIRNKEFFALSYKSYSGLSIPEGEQTCLASVRPRPINGIPAKAPA